MQFITLKLAERWGCPPWEVDSSAPPCGHGPGCPRNQRWIHWQLELMALEGQYGG